MAATNHCGTKTATTMKGDFVNVTLDIVNNFLNFNTCQQASFRGINVPLTFFNKTFKVCMRPLQHKHKQYKFSHKQLVLVTRPCFHRACSFRWIPKQKRSCKV
jgi:hypothetical protein